MPTSEIEIKILNVDYNELASKLHELGFEQTHELTLFERYVYELEDASRNKVILRIRQEGTRIFLNAKRNTADFYQQEYEVSIVSEKDIINFFRAICEYFELCINDVGYILDKSISNIENIMFYLYQLYQLAPDFIQENYVQRYTLGNLEVSFVRWPGIPPFIEIENSVGSENEIIELINLLGFTDGSFHIIKGQTVKEIYQFYGIDISTTRELKFS